MDLAQTIGRRSKEKERILGAQLIRTPLVDLEGVQTAILGGQSLQSQSRVLDLLGMKNGKG